MAGIQPVETPPIPVKRLASLVGKERFSALEKGAAAAREELAGSTVWNVSSSEAASGVAEMLRVLVGYTIDAGIDARWQLISADPAFFRTAKRLHHQLHGFPGSGEITADDVAHYGEVTDALGVEFADAVRPGDVVLLHDVQTAGMTARLAAAGAHVIWRCHAGVDNSKPSTAAAWDFLKPHLEQCQAFIFSGRAYAPDWLAPAAVVVIPSSVDPFSPKNEDLSDEAVAALLAGCGFLTERSGRSKKAARAGGEPVSVSTRAAIVRGGEPLDPSVPLVVQVSGWDVLKDMAGVMAGFAEGVVGRVEAHLALVGPVADASADDPEASGVLADCVSAWEALPDAARASVSIVCLPVDDLEENALLVNAFQRHAAVVTQKSLAEGFGLTVAEAMLKGKPVVASAVGGIVDQIVPGSGVLLDDPTDLKAFGDTVARLVEEPDVANALGQAAKRRVQHEFLGDQHLAAYAKLMGELHLRPT